MSKMIGERVVRSAKRKTQILSNHGRSQSFSTYHTGRHYPCVIMDVMHIEKNVCESILGILLDVKGKSKDRLNSHKDLQDMVIWTICIQLRKGTNFICLPHPTHYQGTRSKFFVLYYGI